MKTQMIGKKTMSGKIKIEEDTIMDEKEIKFTVEKIITVGDMEDIFTTAVESGYDGIGYWAVLDNTTDSWKKAVKSLKEKGVETYWGTVMTKIILNGDKIRFYDAEADENHLEPDEIWYLGMEEFQQGCRIYEQERGSLTKNLEDGNFDAVEADCFMQMCIFGKIIFG